MTTASGGIEASILGAYPHMIDLFAFLDTETSGLWKQNLAVDDPSQPHLLQLACRLVNADRQCVGRFMRIIRPDGWSIEPQAVQIHGITESAAHAWGVPLWFALAELRQTVENATTIIAHNMFDFDERLITSAIHRSGHDALWWRQRRKQMVCTMEAATPILQLPGRFDDFKFPSLEEAHNYLALNRMGQESPLGLDWVSTHDAEADIEACEFVFFELRERQCFTK